jgi:hypothetical protein
VQGPERGACKGRRGEARSDGSGSNRVAISAERSARGTSTGVKRRTKGGVVSRRNHTMGGSVRSGAWCSAGADTTIDNR